MGVPHHLTWEISSGNCFSLVVAPPPSINNLRIVGELVEGNTIIGMGNYTGGQEGPSMFQWLRSRNRNSRLVLYLPI